MRPEDHPGSTPPSVSDVRSVAAGGMPLLEPRGPSGLIAGVDRSGPSEWAV
jgi:hypothetical protein